MNTVYILGANSYIGSNLFNYLKNNSIQTIGLVRSEKAKAILQSKLDGKDDDIIVCDYNKVSEYIDRKSFLINCLYGFNGGFFETKKFYKELIYQLSSNKYIDKFIHLSTIAIYLKEKSFYLFDNYYKSSKLNHEKLVLKYFKNKSLILRLGHVYGKNSNHSLFLKDIANKVNPDAFFKKDIIKNFLNIDFLLVKFFELYLKEFNLEGIHDLVDYPQKSFQTLLDMHRKSNIQNYEYDSYIFVKNNELKVNLNLNILTNSLFSYMPSYFENWLRKKKNIKRFHNEIMAQKNQNKYKISESYIIKELKISANLID